jgi:hypothetical protein
MREMLRKIIPTHQTNYHRKYQHHTQTDTEYYSQTIKPTIKPTKRIIETNTYSNITYYYLIINKTTTTHSTYEKDYNDTKPIINDDHQHPTSTHSTSDHTNTIDKQKFVDICQ